MSGVLVIAETRRGALRDITFELMAAGRDLRHGAGGRVTVAVVSADPGSLVGAVASEGIAEVLSVASPSAYFDASIAEQALVALIEAEQPDLVLLGHTIDSLGFGPAVAARLGLGFASDVTGIVWDQGPVATRGAYGDKLVAELDFPGKTCTLLMIRAGVYEPAEGSAAPPVRSVDVAFDAPATEHLEYREVAAGDVDITKADFLLSIGRGIGDRDNLEQFQELAGRLGATLSVSRPLVDAGWMPTARQVGQSGKTVRPAVYLALGISGAVQHLVGIRKAKTIIAVNSDPEAPIFGVAHYGAVADLFEVVDALEEQAD